MSLVLTGLGAQPLFAVQSPSDACPIEIRSGPTLGALEDPNSVSDPARLDVARAPAGDGWIVGDLVQVYVLSYGADGRFRGRFLPRGEGPGEVVPGSFDLGAIVMDREGNALRTLGPVQQSPGSQAMPPRRPAQPLGLAAMGDSVLWGAAFRGSEPDTWVARWTVEGAESLVRTEEVASVLGERTSELRSPFDG